MNDTLGGSAVCEVGEVHPTTILFVLVMGTVLAPLDSSIVNIALPAIRDQFGASTSAVSWVATGYLLTNASLLLSMGRAGDVWGLRRLYVGGLLVFGVGSGLCALAPSLVALVAARIFQAVGASMLFAAGPALVTRTFPASRRGWALGYIALAVSLGLTIGPGLGGLLVDAFGWPSIFLINIPLTAGVAWVAWRLLPDECPERAPFDIVGAGLAALSLLMLLLGLTSAENDGPLSAPVLGGVAAAIILFIAFVAWERRTPHPVVDLALFRSRMFGSGLAAATLAYMSLFAVTFTLPFMLLGVQGLSTREAGFILMVTPIAMAATAPTAGRICDRRGSRGIAVVGLVVLAAGLFFTSLLPAAASAVAVAGCLAVIGTGMALFQTPNTAAVLRATPRQQAGVGSAFVSESRNVGMAIGIAVTAAVVGSQLGPGGLEGGAHSMTSAVAARFMDGMHMSLRLAAVLAFTAAVISWLGHGPDPVEPGTGRP